MLIKNSIKLIMLLCVFNSFFSRAAIASSSDFSQCILTGTEGEFKVKTVTPDTITVATELPHPGLWNGDNVEDIKSGYNYCIIAQIAYRTGNKSIKILPSSFPSIIAGTRKDYDLAISSISITDERKKVVDFSMPYYRSDTGVMVRKGTMVTKTDDLRTLKVGTLEGTTGAKLASSVLLLKNVKVFESTSQIIAALQAKQVDVVLNDLSIILNSAAESKGNFVAAGRYVTGEYYGAIYPKTSPNKAIFDRIIEEMLANGTLKKLEKAYRSPVDPESITLFTK